MEEEIKAEFNRSGFALEEEGETLKKCLTFCINYSLKPSDLVSSWEVYYLNRELNGSAVQESEVDGFLLHLQNEQKEAFIKEEADLHIYSSKDVDMILNDASEEINEEIPGTPTHKSQRLDSDPFDSAGKTTGYGYSNGKFSKLVTPFGQRSEKCAVKFEIDTLCHLENGKSEHDPEDLEDDIIKRVQPIKRCSLNIHKSRPEPGCRFMYDAIEDRFNALENRLSKHASAFVSSGLYEEHLDPTVASQGSVFAVGMICCDGEGHLNEKSILLQSSAEHTGGQRVRLDLQNLNQFSVFPGQVVGIEGHNPSGHCFIASKLVESIPLDITPDINLHPAKKQAMDPEIQSIEASCEPEEISMIIASGPFVTTDNLMFEPLAELLAYAKRKSPQLLILLGPFVDSEHPDIKKGTVDASFNEIFRLEVLAKLQDYVEYMGSDARVILVPSIRDANHDLVFPQPAFDIRLPELEQRIISLSNPATFDANKVKVGCCTVDILKQLSGEELSRSPNGARTDRIARLASHLLRQWSFYPLCPPAENVPLDFSLASETLQISSIPDILILPSDMKYFIKILSLGESKDAEQVKCVCVNPGRLAKGEGGGTFAELKFRGSPDSMKASIIAI